MVRAINSLPRRRLKQTKKLSVSSTSFVFISVNEIPFVPSEIVYPAAVPLDAGNVTTSSGSFGTVVGKNCKYS